MSYTRANKTCQGETCQGKLVKEKLVKEKLVKEKLVKENLIRKHSGRGEFVQLYTDEQILYILLEKGMAIVHLQ